MFCKQCGTQMGGSEKFCPGCGAPVGGPVAPDPVPPAPVTPAPASVYTAPAYAAPAPAAGNPLALRSGGLFLTAVICMSIVVLFQAISLFISIAAVGTVGGAMDMMGLGEIGGGFTVAGILVILVSMSTLAIAVVILVGMWMTYASGLGAGKPLTLIRGLKMIRGGVMAQMIYMIIALALMAIILLLGAIVGGTMAGSVSSYDYYYDHAAAAGLGAATAIFIVMLLFVVGFGALMIAFYVKARAAAGYALTTAQTGRVTGVPSMYLIVMCFVMGGFGLMGALFGGALLGMMYILAALPSVAANILFGIVALQYRSRAMAARY